jgi:hypothetical protein
MMALISKDKSMGSSSFNSRLKSFFSNYTRSNFKCDSYKPFNLFKAPKEFVIEIIWWLASSLTITTIKAYTFLSLLFHMESSL